MRWAWIVGGWAAGAAAIFACATGDASDVGEGSSSSSSSGSSSTLDGSAAGDDAGSSSNKDGSTSKDGASGSDGSTTQDGATGLDPDLKIPGAGQACDPPGASPSGGCPSLSACRIASPTGGRCESCTTCGNLNAPCSAGTECDILFECYKGKCTNFCHLGTMECGAPANCLNVGHPTIGVCKPF